MVHVPCLFINEQVSGLMHTLGGAFSPVDLCVFVFSNFLDLKCGLLFFFLFYFIFKLYITVLVLPNIKMWFTLYLLTLGRTVMTNLAAAVFRCVF